MKTNARSRITLYSAAALLTAVLAAGCSAPAQSTTTDGQALVAEQCGRCHPVERVNGTQKDRAGWTTTVTRMRKNGLEVTDAQAAAIVEYLTKRDGGQ